MRWSVRTTAERFYDSYVPEPMSGCWLWLKGAIHKKGAPQEDYGLFYVPTESGPTTVLAHRWSYEHFVGPIPDGLQIDHLCRVRLCVNPRHLEPVTPRENVWRASRDRCVRGHLLSGDNLIVRRGKHWRRCKKCAYVQNEQSRRKRGIPTWEEDRKRRGESARRALKIRWDKHRAGHRGSGGC